MSNFTEKTLRSWWELINLQAQQVEFIKERIGDLRLTYVLPDGSRRPEYVEFSDSSLDPIERAMVFTMLQKQEDYRSQFSKDREVGTFYWQYLYRSPDGKSFRIDVSFADGILSIWEEMQELNINPGQ